MGKRSAGPSHARISHRKPGPNRWVVGGGLTSIAALALTVAMALAGGSTAPVTSTAAAPVLTTTARPPVIITAPGTDPAEIIDPYAKDQIRASESPSAVSTSQTPASSATGAPSPTTAPATATPVRRISATHIDAPVAAPSPTPPPTTRTVTAAPETVIVEAPVEEERIVEKAAPNTPQSAGTACVPPKGNYDGVKPYVGIIGAHIQKKFNVKMVAGKAGRNNVSEHPKGLALDFMTNTGNVNGDAIRDYLLEHAKDFNIKYVIWKQTLFLPGKAPRAMEDRGSITANHFDHVHVSFNDAPGPVTPTC